MITWNLQSGLLLGELAVHGLVVDVVGHELGGERVCEWHGGTPFAK